MVASVFITSNLGISMQRKTLTFLRHADADQATSDINRPLSQKGKSQADHRASNLKDHNFDLVIVSAALRAKETAEIILDKLSSKAPMEEVLELYVVPDRENSTPEEISEIILSRISKHEAKDILIIGHANIINALGHLQLPSATDLLTAHFSPTEGFTIREDGNLTLIQN